MFKNRNYIQIDKDVDTGKTIITIASRSDEKSLTSICVEMTAEEFKELMMNVI